MFRTTRYIKSLIIVAAAVAAACTEDPVDPASPEPVDEAEPASLTINFSIADLGIGVSTRTETGGGTSDNTDPTPTPTPEPGLLQNIVDELDPDSKVPMSSEAAFIDGRKMTCLTVILIHRPSNKIVGVRRIPDKGCHAGNQDDKNNAILDENGDFGVMKDQNGNVMKDENGEVMAVGTTARVSFDYNNPIHKVTQEMVDKFVDKAPNAKQDSVRKANEPYIGKTAERLVRGRYSILAVANYDHNVTTSLTGDGNKTLNVDRTLEDIADLFHEPKNMAEGIYPFAPVPGTELANYEYLYNIRFLMNHTLDHHTTEESYDVFDISHLLGKDVCLTSGPLTGNDVNSPFCPYIRPAVHQTLSIAKEFYLNAGHNELNMKLQRISSRTRVEVRNYIPTSLSGGSTSSTSGTSGTGSTDLNLQIHELSFSKNYTQSTCYLFRRNKEDRDYKELATIYKLNDTGVNIGGSHKDHDGKGAPVVGFKGIYNRSGITPTTTAGAIVPFANNMDSNKDGVNDFVGVPAGEKRCIFDAFMYESSLKYRDEGEPADDPDPDSFTYTIDVSYPNITNYKTPDINKIDINKAYSTEYDPDRATLEYAKLDDSGHKDYIHNPASAQDFCNSITTIENTLNKTPEGGTENRGESLCFLIQGVGTSRFLYEKEDGTLGTDGKDQPKKNIDLDTRDIDIKSYLWILEKDAAGNYCYLKNLRSGKYMPEIPVPADNIVNESNCMKSTTKSLTKKFELGVNNKNNNGEVLDEYNVTFLNRDNGRYLSVWSEGPYLSGWHTADQGCQYRLYPVKILPTKLYIGTPRMKRTVELTAFSDETAVVEKVTEIRRNDFIRILVEVSYNPDASEFEFEVSSWKEGGGDVSFH